MEKSRGTPSSDRLAERGWYPGPKPSNTSTSGILETRLHRLPSSQLNNLEAGQFSGCTSVIKRYVFCAEASKQNSETVAAVLCLT